MAILRKILDYVSFGKKDDMAEEIVFEPTDILDHRYQDPSVLITYLKTLGFTDDKITVKVCGPLSPGPAVGADLGNQNMKGDKIGIRLPRKLEKVGFVKIVCMACD